MGTVELTGLEMMRTKALGQCWAMAWARSRTIPALMLKRSSRVIPGLRGTPAGMTTRSQPTRAALRPSPSSDLTWPVVMAGVSTCEMLLRVRVVRGVSASETCVRSRRGEETDS